jgi:hypothetical protein
LALDRFSDIRATYDGIVSDLWYVPFRFETLVDFRLVMRLWVIARQERGEDRIDHHKRVQQARSVVSETNNAVVGGSVNRLAEQCKSVRYHQMFAVA